MKGVPVPPRRVFGVALDTGPSAGRETWVCRATPGSDGIRIESVDPLAELPGGVETRDEAMRFLLGKVLEAPRSAWGVDAPFGAPAAPSRAEDAPAHDPAPWRSRWLASLVEERATAAEPMRRTERARGLEPQTMDRRRFVARSLLQPLADRDEVAVLPFEPLPVLPPGTPSSMAARAPSIYLLECRPEATLAALAGQLGMAGELAPGLAGSPEGRVELLKACVRAGWARPMARRLRTRIGEAESGRALAAVLIAVGAWRGHREHDHGALCRDPHFGLEGVVYC